MKNISLVLLLSSMKNVLCLITTLLLFPPFVYSQIVNIPDPIFKDFLLTYTPTIDINNDGEIQVSEAESVTGEIVYYNNEIISFQSEFNDCYFSPETEEEFYDCMSHLFNHQYELPLPIIKNLTGLEAFKNVSAIVLFDISIITQSKLCINNFNNLNTFLIEFYPHDTYIGALDIPISINIDLGNNPNLKEISISKPIVDSNYELDPYQATYSNPIYLKLNSMGSSNLENLNLRSMHLESLNLSTHPLLKRLSCSNHTSNFFYGDPILDSLDLSHNSLLERLVLNNNKLTTLDITNNVELSYLNCDRNDIEELDLSKNVKLQGIRCSNTKLKTLDLSHNIDLVFLLLSSNKNLSYINLKNGNNHNISLGYLNKFKNLPNLGNICLDSINSNFANFINTSVGHIVNYTDDCTLLSQHNKIMGNIVLDIDNIGCESSNLEIPNLMVTANNGIENYGTFTQKNNDYLIKTSDGDFTTTLTTSLPDYFTIVSNNQESSFVGFDNTDTLNFCITPNQVINDVNISLLPISQVRPGFKATYQIVYKNVGTTQVNGNISLNFDASKMVFVLADDLISTETVNSISFDYSNLNPFESKIINVEFKILSPPTVNIDDVLSLTTSINLIETDKNIVDNVFTLNQIVIGSFDPNDITVLEGDQITLEEADQYLHYIIRFQNTGTSDAVNVVVKNILGNNLDWSTIELENSSHSNRVSIRNGNEVNFIFEGIFLPDSTTNNEGSHGFIAYKIKPQSNIAIGDVMLNNADIIFDFNEAISTNTVSTEIYVLAANQNENIEFSGFPIPTENVFTVNSKRIIKKLKVYNEFSQLVLENSNEDNIDLVTLNNGYYFIQMFDNNGHFGTLKVLKKRS